MKALLMAAVLVAAPGAALADEWVDAARTELQFVELTLANGGWALERKFHAPGLASGGVGYTTLRLDGRHEYTIVALCDEHCGDLDIALFDEDDRMVAEDCRESGLPVVEVAPETRAVYNAEVRMFDCAEDACRYSVAVFSRPGMTPIGSR